LIYGPFFFPIIISWFSARLPLFGPFPPLDQIPFLFQIADVSNRFNPVLNRRAQFLRLFLFFLEPPYPLLARSRLGHWVCALLSVTTEPFPLLGSLRRAYLLCLMAPSLAVYLVFLLRGTIRFFFRFFPSHDVSLFEEALRIRPAFSPPVQHLPSIWIAVPPAT